MPYDQQNLTIFLVGIILGGLAMLKEGVTIKDALLMLAIGLLTIFGAYFVPDSVRAQHVPSLTLDPF